MSFFHVDPWFLVAKLTYPMSINHWLFLTKVVGRFCEFLVYEVVDLKAFDLCLLYLIDNRE